MTDALSNQQASPVSDHAAATAKVIQLRPCQGCAALQAQVDEMTVALSAKTRAHDTEHARAERYMRKLAELQQPDPVDADDLKRFLVFWRDVTGRPKTTRIDLDTMRAKIVRRAHANLKRPYAADDDISPEDATLMAWRAMCFAVLGCKHSEWWAERGLTDIKNVFPSKDEARTDQFIAIGRRVRRGQLT
jgi:hypothetical protein